MDELLCELQERKGTSEGARIYRTILPGILSDFNSMLKNAEIGKTVSEEYRIDDGSGTVWVSGERHADGKTNIRAHLK